MPSSTTVKTTQVALGADVATALYGVNGAGLKIGIISDSFNATGGAAADMAAGILPSVTVLNDPTTGSDEGRAMLELAYSIAPGATYLTSNGNGIAANVTALQNAGANIIIDDLSVGGEALYQLGSKTDIAIEAAVAAGVDYFTSAGNNGNDYYEQGFTPVATTITGIGNVVANDFGSGSPYLSLTLRANFNTNLVFQYAQPFGSFGGGNNSPTNSLAIYLLDSSGTIVASSTTNDVGGDPVQEINFNNKTSDTAYRLVVVQNGGTVPSGELFKFFLNDANGTINSPNAGKGSGDLLGHEMLSDINVLGSVPYTTTPAFGISPAVIDPGSSVGPGTVLFDTQGNKLTTPATQGVPQFEAPDGTLVGTANTTFGTDPFFGTSAAAPSAGAVAALVLESDTKLTTAQVTEVLAQTVIPVKVDAPASGAGLIQARAAVEIATADAGDRWTKATGGNWTDSARWSANKAPTDKEAVSLDNDLGASSGSYTVTVSSTGNRAGSIAIADSAGSTVTLDVAANGELSVGGPKAADRTAGDLLVSDNGKLRVTGGTLKVRDSLNTNNGIVTVTSGKVDAGNYAQNAGSLEIGESGKTAVVALTGTGLAETGGSVTIKSGGTLETKDVSVSSAKFETLAGGTVKDSGTASFASSAAFIDDGSLTAKGAATFDSSSVTIGKAGALDVASITDTATSLTGATFTDRGSVIDKGAASFTSGTVDVAGSFDAGSALLTQANLTDSGSWVDKGALSFDDTTASVTKTGSIDVGSLNVGKSFDGFGNTLTDAGTITDRGNLGIGTSVVSGTVAITASGVLSVGGAVSDGFKLSFLGNGVLDFASGIATTLTDRLLGTISGFAKNNGIIDFSKIGFNSKDLAVYDSKTGDLDLERANGTILANVFLDTKASYSGFNIMADSTNHTQIVVGPTRLA